MVDMSKLIMPACLKFQEMGWFGFVALMLGLENEKKMKKKLI